MGQQVGLDIGAARHAVHLIEGEKQRAMVVANTHQGRRQLIKRLKPGHCRVIMEATGIYYLDTAMDLVEAGVEVMVINPKRAHHFAKALGLNSSTDPISAKVLAKFATTMDFEAWSPPPPRWYEFRSIARQINRLTGEKVACQNRLHALKASRQSSRFLIDDEQQGIESLQDRIQRLLDAAQRLIAGDLFLARLRDHVTAATGFADRSAITILGELVMLPRTMNARQCASHAGLDVRIKQSGTSVNAKPRLSKAGNAYLRAALYMPVLTAVKHDPLAKAHYERLQTNGKTKLQAICALMRKYLTGIWHVVKNDEPFDSQKLFEHPKEA